MTTAWRECPSHSSLVITEAWRVRGGRKWGTFQKSHTGTFSITTFIQTVLPVYFYALKAFENIRPLWVETNKTKVRKRHIILHMKFMYILELVYSYMVSSKVNATHTHSGRSRLRQAVNLIMISPLLAWHYKSHSIPACCVDLINTCHIKLSLCYCSVCASTSWNRAVTERESEGFTVGLPKNKLDGLLQRIYLLGWYCFHLVSVCMCHHDKMWSCSRNYHRDIQYFGFFFLVCPSVDTFCQHDSSTFMCVV